MNRLLLILCLFCSYSAIAQVTGETTEAISPVRYSEIKGQLYRVWSSSTPLEDKRKNAYNITAAVIKEFPKSILTFSLIADQVNLSLGQIDSLLLLVDTSLAHSDYKTSVVATRQRLTITETGKRFPTLALTDTLGQTFQIDSLRGKIVLIDVWATWCVACRAQIPDLRQVYKKYHGKGFEIIGIAIDDDKKKWLEAIAKDKQAWPQFSEFKKLSQTKFMQRFFLYGIPVNYLLDGEGNILGQDLSPEQVEELLKNAIPRLHAEGSHATAVMQ